MKRALTALAAVAILTVAACSDNDNDPSQAASSTSSDNWIPEDMLNNRSVTTDRDGTTTHFGSEQDRRNVFEQWICDTGKNADPTVVSSSAATTALNSDNQDDKTTALDILQKLQGADAIDPGVPLTVAPDGQTCEGWVWDHYLAGQSDKLYDTFTDEKANELGLI
jgi:hypothetical protein